MAKRTLEAEKKTVVNAPTKRLVAQLIAMGKSEQEIKDWVDSLKNNPEYAPKSEEEKEIIITFLIDNIQYKRTIPKKCLSDAIKKSESLIELLDSLQESEPESETE